MAEPTRRNIASWVDHDLARLEEERRSKGVSYLEFLSRPTLRCGLYVLSPGEEVDDEKPHEEDEVYYVVRGKARLSTGSGTVESTRTVGAGDVLFVAARVEHRFHHVEEELQLLVVFSTARP